MRRISNTAYRIWLDTENDPDQALIIVKDGTYIDYFTVAEIKRARARRFYHQHWNNDSND